jgi:hypothetical protein
MEEERQKAAQEKRKRKKSKYVGHLKRQADRLTKMGVMLIFSVVNYDSRDRSTRCITTTLTTTLCSKRQG